MSVNPGVQEFLKELDGDLPEGEVHVWLANLDGTDHAAASALAILNLEEQRRADRFKVDPAREQFVVSRALLRIVIGKYLNTDPRQIHFQVGPHGKLDLVEHSDLRFNLSHTQGLTAIGTTRLGRIGVDVERVQREINALELADRFFSTQEAGWVRSHPVDQRTASFLACWTAKEAYVKAHGGGLSIPLDGFAAIPEPTTQRVQLEVFGDAQESRRWSMWRLDLPSEFKGALAVEAENCKLRVGQLTSLHSLGPK